MLILRANAWTRLQKGLIVGASIALIALCAGGVYIYERFYRGPTEDVFFGTWVVEGCYDCTSLITFQPNHDVIKFEDYWEQNHLQIVGAGMQEGDNSSFIATTTVIQHLS